MSQQGQDAGSLQSEIDYYKRQIEELAGENLKFDIAVSGLRHEVRQRRKGFALLSELQQTISEQTELSSFFEVTMEAINATLGMDKTVVLTPKGEEHAYRPSQWLGFLQPDSEQLSSLSLRFPEAFAEGSGLLLVNRSTEPTPLVEEIRSAFDLPYFICLPVMVEKAPIGLLLSGRLREAKPFYPPLDQGDVDTFQAIAGLIASTIRNRRLTVLRETDRLKTEFFANISHEFRTPITLTLGPLDQILKGRYGDVPDAVGSQLLILQRNQERLLALINQVLDLSKLEAGSMQLKAAPMPDINRFVAERVGQFSSAAEERGIELKVLPDPQLDGADLYIDGGQFEKLLFNLVSNALKFTRQGCVEVSTEIHQGAFRLAVRDTGIGIKPDQLPHIFDRFRQADGSESREHAGTGLGLALVKEVARLHGGDVKVHSEYGKGSLFHVTIPLGKSHLDPASVVEVAEEQRTTPSGTRQRVFIIQEGAAGQENADETNKETEAGFDTEKSTVLYVEDNPDLRRYVRHLLADRYNVFLAVDGRDGLGKARKYRPDIIITDQMMPQMSGRALLRAIREDPELHSIPVIFLTARAGAEARIESLDAGADDYVCKPFDEAELLIRVRNLLQARAQEKELAELNRQLGSKVEEQMAQLELASRIQKDLLPKDMPEIEGYEIVGRNLPAKTVGGDYFDFISLDESRIAICLGDVCGKGLPASLLMANLQATVRGQACFSADARQCLERSNKLLYDSTDMKTFVSLFYGILDIAKHSLRYANAGQNWPLIFSPGKPSVALQTSGLVLGAMEKVSYEEEEVIINPGDLLVIYSDGICEAMDEKYEEFGDQRLQEIVTLYKDASAREVVERILSAVELFTRGAEQSDDMTLVVVKRRD